MKDGLSFSLRREINRETLRNRYVRNVPVFSLQVSILFLFLLIQPAVFSQSWKHYLFTEEIQEKYAEDSNVANVQQLILEAMNTGNYELSLQLYDKIFPRPSLSAYNDSLLSSDSFSKEDAKTVFLALTDLHQVTLLSDAYFLPSQRCFLKSVLPELWKQGYRYLGLEGLYADTIAGKTLLTDSLSFYMFEKNYRELVQTALDLGFILFSFDDLAASSWNERLERQVQKAATFLSRHPEGKTLFFCNTSHLDEYQDDSLMTITSIASFLCQKADMNPLTVNQSFITERSEEELESRLIREIQHPVCLKKDEEIFGGFGSRKIADMIVFLPEWKVLLGLADQQTANFTVPHKRIIDYPVFLMAFEKETFEKGGFPFTLKEVKSKEDNTSFYLPKGTYTFLFLYRDRELFHTLNVIKTK